MYLGVGVRTAAQDTSKPLTGHPAMVPIRTGIALLMAGCFLSGCSDSPKSQPNSTPSKSSGNPLTAPVDYLGAAANAKKSTVKTVDEVGMKKTIQMFYAAEGRFPKSLNELVAPDYLSSLPAPPPGMKFDYNPATGDFKVVPQ
jgi:hypothetical protein